MACMRAMTKTTAVKQTQWKLEAGLRTRGIFNRRLKKFKIVVASDFFVEIIGFIPVRVRMGREALIVRVLFAALLLPGCNERKSIWQPSREKVNEPNEGDTVAKDP